MRWVTTVVLISSPFLPMAAGAQAQQQATGNVQGTITASETGQSLASAHVAIDGTEHRANTSGNGRFVMTGVAPGMYQVSVSLLGYADRTVENVAVVAGQTITLDILLETSAISLAEVVVVGYGEQRRATITGAVSSVTGAELARAPVPNLLNSLAGRASGVVINNRSGVPGRENTSILIRGRSTFGSLNDNGPLYVIDGVAGRGGLTRLNPDEIDSITILKDASAAIYGAQAGNGVVLIQTKAGRPGRPRVTVNMNYGYSEPTSLTRLVDSWDYATYINELNQSLGAPPLYTQDQIDLFRSGTDPLRYPNTNWIDAITRSRAPQMEHRVDVSGGTGEIRYFLSGQYLDQEGIFKDPSQLSYNQYSMRANVSAQVHDNLNLDLRVGGRYEDRNGSNFDANGIFVTAASNYPVQPAVYPNGLPSIGIEFNNPLVRAQGLTGYERQKDFQVNSTLNFRLDMPAILSGLYVSGLGAFDIGFRDFKEFSDMWDWVEYDPATDEYIDYRDRTAPINLTRSMRNNSRRTYNIRVGLDRAFGRHQIQTFAAHERSQMRNDTVRGFRTNFPSSQIHELSAGDTEGMTNTSGSQNTARMHYFGRMSYSFDDKYLAEFTLRHDGSDRFPPEGRWGTFPGVSAAWRISQERFFNIDAFNDLKLKASWGRLGSDGQGNYQFLARYGVNQTAYVFGSTPARTWGLNPQVEPNPAITWETVDKWNVGFESTLWDGALSLELNAFWDDRQGILISRNASVPNFTGLSLPDQNLGRIKKRGFDGSLMHSRTIGNLRYSLSPNFTYALDEIVYMDEAANVPDHQRQTGFQLGSDLYYQDCGLFRSQAEIDARPHRVGTQPGDICFEDIDGDGEITPQDRIRIFDNPTPRFQAGIITAAGYGPVNLDLVWQGQAGAKADVRPQAINAPVTPPKWLFDGRWTPENPDAKWPKSFDRRNTRNADASTFWLRDASYIRLKSAELSYDVPAHMATRLSLQNMRVYLQGFNLFTLTGIEGYDPELNVVNTYNYPQQRAIGFGISATLGGAQ